MQFQSAFASVNRAIEMLELNIFKLWIHQVCYELDLSIIYWLIHCMIGITGDRATVVSCVCHHSHISYDPWVHYCCGPPFCRPSTLYRVCHWRRWGFCSGTYLFIIAPKFSTLNLATWPLELESIFVWIYTLLFQVGNIHKLIVHWSDVGVWWIYFICQSHLRTAFIKFKSLPNYPASAI